MKIGKQHKNKLKVWQSNKNYQKSKKAQIWVEKYKNWTKEFNKGVKVDWLCRRKYQQTLRRVYEKLSSQRSKKKK